MKSRVLQVWPRKLDNKLVMWERRSPKSRLNQRQLATRCLDKGEPQARDPRSRPRVRDIRVQRHAKNALKDDAHRRQVQLAMGAEDDGLQQTCRDEPE